MSLIEQQLNQTPARYAYYPGAAERFESFAECRPDDRDYLPWTIRRNIDLDAQRRMLAEESFVCVCGEIALEADSVQSFLQNAVALVNEEVWGTLAATLTVPKKLQRSDDVDTAVQELRYGTIGVNQWAAVAFALMSPPWGAFAGSTIDNVQSGIGFVHNTYMLNRPQKTILKSPLTIFPKPIWFNSHRCPEQLAWRLLDLYNTPSIWRIPALLGSALLG